MAAVLVALLSATVYVELTRGEATWYVRGNDDKMCIRNNLFKEVYGCRELP